ncbi:hypothetical protein CVT26_016014 [Gymnopilus dilepis]|uniref:Peptidase A1 domain-containing protein n=1 Tax=Gymnopilus dilepis TaxID=231916 RepID=A0A409YDI7_9AGAR|nr:hypothetical protein CVT26_016014 [Gymnopilus dilepis]
MTLLAVALSLLAAPCLSEAIDPVHVPLTRRHASPGSFDPNLEAYKVKLKYGFIDGNTPAPLPRRVRRGTAAAVPITNQGHDNSFLGSVSVGTPPQTFTIVLDSGSSDFWLASTGCSNCKSNAPVFQSSKSQSFHPSAVANSDISINYESGAVSGSMGSDSVKMGGFTVASQTFVTVNSVTSNVLQGEISGLMGLAFSTLAVTRATPFWQALLNANQFSSPDMSFWLARANPSSTAEEVNGGVFTLGGTNSSLFSGDIDFQQFPVNTPSYWLQTLSSVTVNGQTVDVATGPSVLSAIDTGTTLIVGPANDVAAIWEAVPNSSPSDVSSGFFRYPCSAEVNISLSFGGKTWPIDPRDMNIGQETPRSSFCLGALMTVDGQGASGTPSWIIGDTFLKNVYTVFRASPPSVGFAQLSTLAGGTVEVFYRLADGLVFLSLPCFILQAILAQQEEWISAAPQYVFYCCPCCHGSEDFGSSRWCNSNDTNIELYSAHDDHRHFTNDNHLMKHRLLPVVLVLLFASLSANDLYSIMYFRMLRTFPANRALENSIALSNLTIAGKGMRRCNEASFRLELPFFDSCGGTREREHVYSSL